MADKPDIVKKLMEEERLGTLESGLQGFHEELEPPAELPNESFEDVSEGNVDFVGDDAEKKERIGYTTDHEQTPWGLQDNEMYRAIFENISDGIVYVDKHGKILNANNGSFDIFGYKPEEIIGKNFSKLGWFGTKDLPKMFRFFKGAIKDRAIDLMELEVKHKAGHIVSVEVSAWPVKKNGSTAGFLSIVRDVTERKKAEELLKESKQHFQTLFNNMVDPVAIIDSKGKFLDVTDKIQEITGFKKEEIIGKNFIKTLLLTAKSKALTIKNLGKRMAGMNVEPYIVDVLTKDGRKIPFEINAEEKFKIITEQSLVGILIAQNNKIEYVNEEYAEIFGYSVDEVMKWNMKDAINAI
ncbi:MAG: PAS domain S-box protein, partial [Candidatus Thermoplasmatota archaeon]|nr:PAS domain S-box protein [Candidatus Thermoplasmatota archaeon]